MRRVYERKSRGKPDRSFGEIEWAAQKFGETHTKGGEEKQRREWGLTHELACHEKNPLVRRERKLRGTSEKRESACRERRDWDRRCQLCSSAA